MNESDIVRATIQFDDDGKPVVLTSDQRPDRPMTDWARLAAMTEDEIEANAANDPDNPPLTDEELAELRPVFDLRALRSRLCLTQEQFAERFQIPLGTLRDWEQGRRVPDTTARTLLRVIDFDPDLVAMAVSASADGPRRD